jgi:3',5'-cyclic-AMP phosphodiesterase
MPNEAPEPAAQGGRGLCWLHVGDLHLTTRDAENRRSLDQIVALLNALPSGSLDFAVLPGDNADDGTPEQYAILDESVRPLRVPLHILPGDHDMKPGNLDAFYAVPATRTLPFAVRLDGYRCLFLDVVSAGTGGPDFRLGDDQLAWTESELGSASTAGERAVVFMHTYPADLREGADRLRSLLAEHGVLCVDMGHTHYNELANDGRTIFMATRSTGQIEEGPPGFSIAAIDAGVVSWRFKPLDEAWPFILITQPADRRLVTQVNQVVSEPFLARAKVLGDARIERVEVQVDDGPWEMMTQAKDEPGTWQHRCAAPGDTLRVRACDAAGRSDADAIQVARPGWAAPDRAGNGSDEDRLEAWLERGILGTQLGPNRNGRQW